jgi:WG containing repeat
LNDSVGFYSAGSFPYKTDFHQIMNLEHQNFFQLKDFRGQYLLFDKKGKLLLPPQYLIKNITQNAVVAYDSLSKKYVFVDTLGHIITLNSNFIIKAVQKDIVVVEDPMSHLLGVIDLKDNTIIPNTMAAISVSESEKLLWLKTTLPNLPLDSISYYDDFRSNPLDEGWMMYNLKGKPLNTYKFSMPIAFEQNIGIGRLTENKKYGIWQSNGSNLLPPQYDYILRDTSEGVFYIFKRWADSTLAVGYCDYQGKVIKEPRFDKMSRFFGDYSMVQTNGEIGVIHKNGEWLCPPYEGSMINFKGNLIDSFHKVNLKYNYESNGFRKYFYDSYPNDMPFRLPFGWANNLDFEKSRDLLPNTTKNTFSNLFLWNSFKALSLNTNSNFNIRITDTIHKTSNFINSILKPEDLDYHQKIMLDHLGSYDRYKNRYSSLDLVDFEMSENFGGIINHEYEVNNFSKSFKSLWKAHNFYQNEEKKWIETTLEDWLNINRDNALLLNDLLFQKIKTLKNENLDCSNSGSFFENSKHWYYIKKEGITFFIPRTKGKYGQARGPYEWYHAPVLLTWEDLKPISKKQP